MTPQEIRDWRKARGLTQSEMAELLLTDQTTVSRWETGRVGTVASFPVTLLGADVKLARQREENLG